MSPPTASPPTGGLYGRSSRKPWRVVEVASMRSSGTSPRTPSLSSHTLNASKSSGRGSTSHLPFPLEHLHAHLASTFPQLEAGSVRARSVSLSPIGLQLIGPLS